jgi:hypothetical protein
VHRTEVKGYIVVSNDLKFYTRLLPRRKELKIRIPMGSARMTETKTNRRDAEIKISTWNKISRVKVRVPFGFQPEELRVIERPLSIDVYAPYDFIEFSTEQPKPTKGVE